MGGRFARVEPVLGSAFFMICQLVSISFYHFLGFVALLLRRPICAMANCMLLLALVSWCVKVAGSFLRSALAASWQPSEICHQTIYVPSLMCRTRVWGEEKWPPGVSCTIVVHRLLLEDSTCQISAKMDEDAW